MCAPNKTKKGKKAFSYLFYTHYLPTLLFLTYDPNSPYVIGETPDYKIYSHAIA